MQPKLIHSIDIVVRNVDKGSMVYDDDFGVPVDSVTKYGNQIKFKAQVSYNRYKLVEGVASGFELRGDGHLTAYKEDVVDIEWNAKIESIGGEAVEYYINDIVPLAHYENSNLKMLFFVSKDKGSE